MDFLVIDSHMFKNVLKEIEPIFPIRQLTSFGMMVDLIWINHPPTIPYRAFVVSMA
jgi:hypothetical protein